MDVLRPSYEKVADIADTEEKARRLEKEAVLVSLGNLMTYPFLQVPVLDGDLTLHGLWHDIGAGTVESYSRENDDFVLI
jgi:carbonic anhydrase